MRTKTVSVTTYRPGAQYAASPGLTATVVKTFGPRVRLRIGDTLTDVNVAYDKLGAFLKLPHVRRRVRPADFQPAMA